MKYKGPQAVEARAIEARGFSRILLAKVRHLVATFV
jgi:hypothetical protein